MTEKLGECWEENTHHGEVMTCPLGFDTDCDHDLDIHELYKP